MSETLTFDTVDELASSLAVAVERWVKKAVEERGVAHVTLAGGSTPAALHKVLAKRDLPWSSMHFYFGDERAVPFDHADSNFRAADQSLFSLAPVVSSHIHRMPAEDRAEGARAYSESLPERMDVVLLGMGEDGHTASLFPGSAVLESTDAVLYVNDSPKPPPERLTLSFRTLNRARHVAFMIAGAGKAQAFSRVVSGELLPVARVKPDDGTLSYYVDRAAAGLA